MVLHPVQLFVYIKGTLLDRPIRSGFHLIYRFPFGTSRKYNHIRTSHYSSVPGSIALHPATALSSSDTSPSRCSIAARVHTQRGAVACSLSSSVLAKRLVKVGDCLHQERQRDLCARSAASF